ncbi:MAG TPA: protein kinase [Candidatus Sulfotelmatobacter sp.]
MDTPSSPKKLANRYEVRQILGQGGMGLVYRAYDVVVRREVAVKTILDIPDPASLQLFYKECDVLASMSHPNIVEIFDIGEFEEDGKKKPYFVMPLLPGSTLEYFIRKASHRLTVERTIDIVSQTCRGLQAAHERGLVHRDLKPSNIFVMEDDSVKIIDFGVAHMADAHTTRAQKGTLLYMSPEQIELKPLTPASDIFSLSVVCYEAMTGRNPFQRARPDEVVDAILRQIPPLACELNSTVSQPVSRVLHKAMAKQSWHRFASAKDFGDTLNKGQRNEPIEFFDPERTRPRLQRATKALEEGDHQFAGEILGELEAEGHMDAAIGSLRRQLDAAVRRKTLSQLLDAARARFEEEEDPLALQKLQEALQIEPDNATALALKSKIENRRSERQIDNWYRLARQHIENHAYGHAREALQNVLQLRPKEARALQLLAEVDRQEQEYKKLRQEKENIHRAAVEAWQKGDVSAALSKLGVVLELDRKAPDSINRESGAKYQSFYNEVRSEHDAMNAAYAEARKHLTEHNFAKAKTACETYLSKYPNNAIFQALKYDIEEHQRQDLSAFIASVDRRVENEPDLDKRVGILREALDLHPDESHFERSLRLVQDKRDLVNSIVARAHLHEEQGLYSDALNDCEILRTIYSQYPGLSFEVERLQKRRDQQSRIESKSRLVEEVDARLHASDYSRALELLQEASKEFPNDAELAALKKRAQDGSERKTEADRVMNEGQDLFSQEKSAVAIKVLRHAFELDENNPLTRAVLANALMEFAHAIVESDWQESEKLTKEALDLNPAHPMGKTIKSLIQDQKKETFVQECVSQARELQTGSNLAGALTRIEEGLSVYPRDPRLIQIQESVQRDLQSQRRQARRRDVEELRRMESEVSAAKDAASKQALAQRLRAVMEKYSTDGEVLSIANGLLHKLGMFDAASKPLTASPESESATQTFHTPMPQSPTSSEISSKVVQVPPAKASEIPVVEVPVAEVPVAKEMRPVPPAPPIEPVSVVSAGVVPPLAPTRRESPKPLPFLKLSFVGAAVVIIVLVGAIVVSLRKHRTPESTATSQPAPTAPAPTPAPAPSASAISAPEPLAASIKLSSDTGSGKVALDSQPPAELQDGQWTADNLSAGEHKLKIEGARGEASLTFSTSADSMPTIKTPIASKGAMAIITTGMADHLRVYSSETGTKLSLDGQPAIDIPPSGADLNSIPSGAHQLSITHGSDQYKLDLEASAAPVVNLFLESGQNLGTLVVVAGQDQAKVYLNGKALPRLTRNGQLRISNLEPKDYSVRVSKNGFADSPEQKIRVRKGEQTRLTFNLQATPHLASLAIQGGIPGTTVLIDQATVGTVQSDGTLNLNTVSPGDHTVELRKDRYKWKQFKKHFTAGAPVALSATDAALEAAPGELKISFTPADAIVTVSKGAEAPTKVTSGAPMSLPAGSYNLNARTSDNFIRSATVEIAAGQIKSLDLSLAADGMAKWADPAGWKQEKGAFARKGGDFVMYNLAPTSGTFTFSAKLNKGHRLQWLLNCTDANNYVLFQMDDDNFYRTIVHNGQKGDEIKIPHKTDKKAFRTLMIRVGTSEIVHQIKQGDSWVVLDRFSVPGSYLNQGRFGFYIPGGDQVALANFSHYSDLNLK